LILALQTQLKWKAILPLLLLMIALTAALAFRPALSTPSKKAKKQFKKIKLINKFNLKKPLQKNCKLNFAF